MKHLIIIAVFVSAPLGAIAQTVERYVVAPAGTSASAATVQMDYTIGEIVTQAPAPANTFVTPGFNQPASNNSSIKAISTDQFVSIYPNPTNGIINLEAKMLKTSAEIIVCDAMGKTVTGQVWYTETLGVIDGSQWAPGLYTIRILADNKLLVYRLTKI